MINNNSQSDETTVNKKKYVYKVKYDPEIFPNAWIVSLSTGDKETQEYIFFEVPPSLAYFYNMENSSF